MGTTRCLKKLRVRPGDPAVSRYGLPTRRLAGLFREVMMVRGRSCLLHRRVLEPQQNFWSGVEWPLGVGLGIPLIAKMESLSNLELWELNSYLESNSESHFTHTHGASSSTAPKAPGKISNSRLPDSVASAFSALSSNQSQSRPYEQADGTC